MSDEELVRELIAQRALHDASAQRALELTERLMDAIICAADEPTVCQLTLALGRELASGLDCC